MLEIKTIIGLSALFIYIVIFFAYISFVTEEDDEFHEGGFLGMGYTSTTSRKLTPRDVRKGLIWPILGIIFFTKFFICLINDTIYVFGLILGLHYNHTRIYEFITKKFEV